ncbi:MAG: putative quinol monooxygenase [Pseudomonadota bacterium]
MLSVIAKLPIKEDKLEEAIGLVKELMSQVAQEEGTMLYTLNQDKNNPNTLVFMERYKDKNALAAHGATAHFQEFFKRSAGLMSGQPEIIVMKELASI